MSNVKRITFIAVFLIVVGLVGAFLTYDSYADGGVSAEEERTFNDKITDIIIETGNIKIEVLPSDDNTTKVEFKGNTNKKSRYHFDADVENGTLHVEVKEKVLQYFNFDFTIKSAVTRVYLPEETYHSIIAETRNGKILVENISADTFSAETKNGVIDLENINTDVAHLQSVNGKIRVNDLEGELHAEVTNGTIDTRLTRLDWPINLESVNGKIKVEVDEEPDNAEIIVDVVNGSVNVFGKNSQHTVFGEGDNLIKLKTVNGSINVGY